MTPTSLRVNAYSPGLKAAGPLAADWSIWATKKRMQRETVPTLAFAEGPDLRDWRHPKVGWGVVLPENLDLEPEQRARPLECPPTVQKVISQRNGVVVRYRGELMPEKLRRYYADGTEQDCRLIETERGIDIGELPMYLVILASPERIPWKHQYVMSGTRFVGRLDLPPDALENYFDHLGNNWGDSLAKPLSAVTWAVDWGAEDITSLMRRVLADAVDEDYRTDRTMSSHYLHDQTATISLLTEALVEHAPGLIVTTSHGLTGPLNDVDKMRASLGLLIDQGHKTLDPAALLKAWHPDGAIWYAHACCSAGADSETSFAGLFDADGDIDRLLQGVAKVGSVVSPLPTALLSASKPVRAFVGHVEPTFDWPLQDPETGQPLGNPFREALTSKLYAERRHPVGSAFREVHALGAAQFQLWDTAVKESKATREPAIRQTKREMALRAQLGGIDWQSLVILGDPTVAIPAV